MIDVRVQSGDFDPGRQLARLEELSPRAVASLTIHAAAADDVTAIVLEHYAAMAKAELFRLAEEAKERGPVLGIIVIHRHGRFAFGERVLFTGVAANTRPAAQEACTSLAEAISRSAPFWRREILADGGSRWVRAR